MNRRDIPRDKEYIRLDFDALPKTIGIVGSRSFTNNDGTNRIMTEIVRRFVWKLPKDVEIVSGGAKGVDTYAADAAREHKRTLKEEWPDNHIPTPQRYFERNKRIVEYLDEQNGLLVAFVDLTKMRGTQHTIGYAKEIGVPTIVYKFARYPLRHVGVDVDGCEQYIGDSSNG